MVVVAFIFFWCLSYLEKVNGDNEGGSGWIAFRQSVLEKKTTLVHFN